MDDRFYRHQAESDFIKARTKAAFTDIQHFMNTDRNDLLSFSDVKALLKPKNEVYMGMQEVPIKLIAGSEGRYRDFNNHFLPRSDFLKNRWESVDRAHLADVILPPIQLYELGGVYFVRDGNHRVSVAKAQGVECIDAEVISLQSEIKLTPELTTEEIRQRVIQYEKREFYIETGFGDLTDYWDMNFTNTGGYDVICNHIFVHKYYINENQPEEITFQDAVVSWFKNVYQPVITIIKREHMLRYFKKRTESDLYVWLVKHWDSLKHKYGLEYPLPAAAFDFSRRYGVSRLEFIRLFFKNLFHHC